MKQATILLMLVFAMVQGRAQSISDGYRQLYYERYMSATNTFEQILQKQPDNAEAVYGLTKAYLLEEEPAKAQQLLEGKKASIGTQPYYQVAYGTYLLQQGKKEEAQTYFQQALAETKEKDAGILAAIAQSDIDFKGDALQAVALMNKALEKDKKNAGYEVILGTALRKSSQGDGSAAYQAYERAKNIDPNYAAAYYQLGGIFYSQKNVSYFVYNLDAAIKADPDYAPAYYTLYTYYFSRDPKLAMENFNKYLAHADQDWRTEYAKLDLLYLNKQFGEAISSANKIIQRDGDKAKGRLYKLIAYSYAEQKDTAQALANMQTYFAKELDSNFIAKDFESISEFFESKGNLDSAAAYLVKGTQIEKDSAELFPLYKKLAGIYKLKGDYSNEAIYMGKYYVNNPKATNVDLFNWGLEHYRAKEYAQADSVFDKYIAAYPQQGFGYYWKARSQALLDPEMAGGLAVPTYQKLVEVIGANPTDATNKKWMIEAYSYLAAYETNNQKDYAEAIDYFNKVLAIDPNNADAQKYIGVLEKSLAKQDKSTSSK